MRRSARSGQRPLSHELLDMKGMTHVFPARGSPRCGVEPHFRSGSSPPANKDVRYFPFYNPKDPRPRWFASGGNLEVLRTARSDAASDQLVRKLRNLRHVRANRRGRGSLGW